MDHVRGTGDASLLGRGVKCNRYHPAGAGIGEAGIEAIDGVSWAGIGIWESCDPQFSQKADPAILTYPHVGQLRLPPPVSGTWNEGARSADPIPDIVRRSNPQLSQKINSYSWSIIYEEF